MILITFPDGTDWFKANWVFREFSVEIAAMFTNDEGVLSDIERIYCNGGINFAGEDPVRSAHLAGALRRAAAQTVLKDSSEWRFSDPERHRAYIESVKELRDLLARPGAA